MKRSIPGIASWLLDRFEVTSGNEALLGDLEEERLAGRSLFWVWRQTLVAIAEAVIGELGNHKLLALRAVATGWILDCGGRELYGLVARGWLIPHFGFPLPYGLVVSIFLIYVWPVMLGWAVARTHGSRPAMAAGYSLTVAIILMALLCTRLYFYQGHYSPLAYARTFFAYTVLTLAGGLLVRPRRFPVDKLQIAGSGS